MLFRCRPKQERPSPFFVVSVACTSVLLTLQVPSGVAWSASPLVLRQSPRRTAVALTASPNTNIMKTASSTKRRRCSLTTTTRRDLVVLAASAYVPPEGNDRNEEDGSKISAAATVVSPPVASMPPYSSAAGLPTSATTIATTSKDKKPLHPRVGDIVRYYDLDGGKPTGQVLVGKITFIQPKQGPPPQQLPLQQDLPEPQTAKPLGWLVELNELEDSGDGYYAEYTGGLYRTKKTVRDLMAISPIAASFVQREGAYRVPRDRQGQPQVRQPSYDVEDYLGPRMGVAMDDAVVAQDAARYNALKFKIIRDTVLVGAAGTLVADLIQGTEDALIYAGGVMASLSYLYLLLIKTDSLGSPNARLGWKVSNVRFGMPFFLIAAVALYNAGRGQDNPVLNRGLFEYVTMEQFAVGTLGFLTYRVPLFVTHLPEYFQSSSSSSMSSLPGGTTLPGSTALALQLLKSTSNPQRTQTEPWGQRVVGSGEEGSLSNQDNLVTVLLVSGPQSTGRSALVQRLLQHGQQGQPPQQQQQHRLVEPVLIDRVRDSANFERLEHRDELLQVDRTGRYGLTYQGILQAAGGNTSSKSKPDDDDVQKRVVVVDASVELARKLTKLSGLRLVGVWVGLSTVEEFDRRIQSQIDAGEIAIAPDESRDSVTQAKIREIVKEIEYGISSGIFEFTILNEDDVSSLQQLLEAAAYCFK